jgi:hypothetical protein
VVLDAVVDLQESASRTRMFWEADPNARGRNGGVRQELAAGVKKAAVRPAAKRLAETWAHCAGRQAVAALVDASYQTYCHARAKTITATIANKPN